MLIRQSARKEYDTRLISFVTHVSHSADGSCVIKMGNTQVFCTAFLEREAAEPVKTNYSVFSAASRPTLSTNEYTDLESNEIKKAIKNSLLSVLDLSAMGSRGLLVDCCVIQSEGSLRAAAISGAYVAAAIAIKRSVSSNFFVRSPIVAQAAGISCGMIKKEIILDLDSEETVQADVVANFTFQDDARMISLLIDSKGETLDNNQINKLMEAAAHGARFVLDAQKKVVLSS